jgi:RNA polymerase sigma factor (sigma-70 family)
MFSHFEAGKVSWTWQATQLYFKSTSAIQEGMILSLTLSATPSVAGTSVRNIAQQPDQRLLSAARMGDSSAFGELCKRHEKRIFHVVLRITRNREDAEDALQECFLNAMVHLGAFDGRSQFATWLTRIAINAALMKIRRNRTSRETPLQTADEFGAERESIHLIDHSLNPEESYAKRETSQTLRGLLGRLRPRIRAAIEMRHLQDCSLRETAQKLGISQAATKGRLFQARAALRKSWRVRSAGTLRAQRAA